LFGAWLLEESVIAGVRDFMVCATVELDFRRPILRPIRSADVLVIVVRDPDGLKG
jgi:hypothetical protein